MNEQAIRTYWRDFVNRNGLTVGANQEPRSLQTLFYRLHKIRGSRLTDAEAATVEARVNAFAQPEGASRPNLEL